VCLAPVCPAADKAPPPRLPLAPFWSVTIGSAVSAGPVSDGERVYLALKSAHVTARDAKDGRELWKKERNVTTALAVDGEFVFVPAGDAIEALRGSDGATAWTVPRVKVVAPLLAADGWLIAVTDAEVLAIRSRDGAIVWRVAAGGVERTPAIDGDRLYVGAKDGRVLGLALATGAVAWEEYVQQGGVTTIAARHGLVYVGAGNKYFYCLDGRNGKEKWPFRVGSIPTGRIAVDDERVYFAALDNVIRALDRKTGNQHWKTPLPRRAVAGVVVRGHVVFVPVTGSELVMIYDHDGQRSGQINLPGETEVHAPPDVHENADGLRLFVVTGGLSNEWHLTFIASVGEAAIVPFAEMAPPGVLYLVDPLAEPIGKVLPWLLLGDPLLQPFSEIEWPVVLRDPPLVPLTTLPGIQLRPLSPVLPVRRES
jgi:outer membrane protein assembly factor BamB